MSRRNLAIGQNLWLVEGAERWAIYDFTQRTIFQIDKLHGETVELISNLNVPISQKLQRILRFSPALYQKIIDSRLRQRIFRDDSKISNSFSPSMLWIEVTNRCNQRCVHCYAESGIHSWTSLSLGEVKHLLVEAATIGFYHVQFTGGEPFMHRDLWSAVKFARERTNFKTIEIYTNLTMVTDEDIEKMMQYQVEIATTLLGSNAQVHDLCTATEGSFQKWFERIQKVQKANLKFRIGVVKMRQNAQDMKNIEVFLRENELISNDKQFTPDDVRPTGRGRGHSKLCPKQKDGFFLTVSKKFFEMSHHWNSCWDGIAAVSSDGEMIPCVFSRDLSVGNIRKESFGNLIKKLKDYYWSITLDQVEKCCDCELRYACTDCRALSANSGLGLFGKPVKCSYNPYQQSNIC